MKIITAGETLKIEVKAKDEQSGINKIIIDATNLRDLPGAPIFEARGEAECKQGIETTVVSINIPEYIPDSKWKIDGITIVNGTGRSIKYSPNKDFTQILFTVKAKEGIDLTPAELISVKIV